MKKEGKKRGGIKIEHNKKLFWVIVLLIILLIALILLIIRSDKEEKEAGECKTDSDCVPATCCHPDACVPKEKAPNCDRVMCSMVCSGPLDCGAGYCGCVGGKCNILKKE